MRANIWEAPLGAGCEFWLAFHHQHESDGRASPWTRSTGRISGEALDMAGVRGQHAVMQAGMVSPSRDRDAGRGPNRERDVSRAGAASGVLSL